jgi:hypothetical protein
MACAKNRAGHFFREEALGLAALFTATSEFSQKLKRQLLSSHHPSELFFPSVKRLAYPCVILVPPSINSSNSQRQHPPSARGAHEFPSDHSHPRTGSARQLESHCPVPRPRHANCPEMACGIRTSRSPHRRNLNLGLRIQRRN